MAFINNIDLALYTKFNSPVVNVTINEVVYPISVLVTTPEEQFKKSAYPVPSIGINIFGMEEMPEREVAKVWAYSNPTAETLSRRTAPVKYGFRYQITTESFFAVHDRLLILEIMKRMPPKYGRVTVLEEGNTQVSNDLSCNLHFNLEEPMRTLDDTDGEFKKYRKAFTFMIHGWLDEAEAEVLKKAFAGVELDIDITN